MPPGRVRVTVRFPADHYIATLPPGTRAYVVRQLVDQALKIDGQREKLEEISRKLDLILSRLQGSASLEQEPPNVSIDPDEFLSFF